MKRKMFFAILMASLVLTSCSSDDNEVSEKSGNYFPSTATSFWNYDVTVTDNEANTSDDYQDFLSIEASSTSAISIEANNGNDAYGTMSNILSKSTLTRTDSKLLIDGVIEIPIDGIDDLEIDFNGAVLYDLNASNNEELSVISDEVTQSLQNIPLTLTYTLSFNKLKDQSSLKVNGDSYQNVTSGAISLLLSVSTTIEVQGVDQEFTLLQEKEVLNITSYFGEDVGLLKSESTIDFELEESTVLLLETLGVNLDIEESKSISNKQELSSYAVGN